MNGQLITKRFEIKNMDRLVFGNNNMFAVVIPDGVELAINKLIQKEVIQERELTKEKEMIVKQL